ncbi:TetR/AcrR family transcriptional regulator [Sphingomonas populi]|uniref:TetR/AcrR family transcriptional regulator n=1 Tax=Sphingomonas populi TaxID=2484750 RepID=A0A4Q6XH24_9SPHN|nr:TetR/AcrR family transcriptional regulator [Sphingomonas populi]RZF59240.1 TetR/AcrR family transcriptional regulator [Sphingomonas populi]
MAEVAMGAVDTSGATEAPKCSKALDRIIEASRQEFNELGPAAAKIDSIAARAKMTRQSIYYYYKSKDDIFYDIVIREVMMLMSYVNELDTESTNPEAAIRDLFFGLLNQANKFPTLSAFMIDHSRCAKSIRKPSAAFKGLMQKFVKRLQVLLDRGAVGGVFRPSIDAARLFVAASMITAGARNSRNALDLVCGIDLGSSAGVADWQEFAVDVLMRSIRKTD